MYRIPLSAFGIAIPGFHFDFSFGGCPLFLSVSQSLGCKNTHQNGSPFQILPTLRWNRSFSQLYINLDLLRGCPMIFRWFSHVFPWFTGNWSPLAMLPRWSSTTVTSARILLASCLSWMAWLWTNFHMHNFCVCFGRLAPAKKKLRRSFFGAKKTKKTASVHQHEE